jgi:hypothetical protein
MRHHHAKNRNRPPAIERRQIPGLPRPCRPALDCGQRLDPLPGLLLFIVALSVVRLL